MKHIFPSQGAFSASPQAADRAFEQDNEPAYWPDMAAEIDSEEEILAEELGVSPAQALKIIDRQKRMMDTERALVIGRIVGLLTNSTNIPLTAWGIAFAYGLDEVNGAHSQAEVAKEIGCTRALLSHYTLAVRDYLNDKTNMFDCTKFRKKNETRSKYKELATNPFLEARRKAIKKYRETCATRSAGFEAIQKHIGEEIAEPTE